MLCLNPCTNFINFILCIIAALALGFAITALVLNLNGVDNKGIQAELVGDGGGTLADGGNVIFDTILNDQSNYISYNAVTGNFTITKPGNYLVNWWTTTSGANFATSVSYSVAVNGCPLFHGLIINSVYTNVRQCTGYN